MSPLRTIMSAAVPAPERELDMLFRRQPISVIATIFLSAIATATLWGKVETSTLLAWLLAMLLVSGWRYFSTRRFLGLALKEIQLWRWDNLFTAGTLVSAICWGALPWLVPAGEHAAMQFTVFSLAGVTAFAAVALSSSTRAVVLFLAAVLLPLAARMFAMDDTVHAHIGIVVLLYLGMMLAVALHLQKIIRGALQLDQRNSKLSEMLEQLRLANREKAMFRNMVEMAGDTPIMLYDLQHENRVIYANDAACRHLGVERSALLGLRPFDWDAGVDAASWAELQKQLHRTGGASFETRHRRASGEIVPVSVLVSAFEYEGARYSVSITRDLREGPSLDERRELESLRYLSRFEASMPGFLFTCRRQDHRFTLPFASAAIYEVHGVKASQVTTDAGALWQTVCEADRPALMLAFERSAEAQQMLETDYRIRHPEKGERWVHVRAMPELEDDGDTTVWHGFMYDATEAKQHEARELGRQQEFRALADGSPDVVGWSFSRRR